ncbi:hypothetical protein GCM10023205_58360 [Yinghuangia aomiensis]|uniref:Uncharacterized protein n=1 Tax=Yinghuangia aomiensis TaxID=676205 RepID=A0ABP9HXH9_9ACTN
MSGRQWTVQGLLGNGPRRGPTHVSERLTLVTAVVTAELGAVVVAAGKLPVGTAEDGGALAGGT